MVASTEITTETMIADLIEIYPETIEFLVDEYDFYCFNCIASGSEKLGDGARSHKMTENQIAEMVDNLNLLINGELADY